MKRLVSIVFLSLMLLQAIPVLHFFSSQKEVFYTYIDEEKPEQKLKAGKQDISKEYSLTACFFAEEENKSFFPLFVEKHHASPLLESLTPPPDAC